MIDALPGVPISHISIRYNKGSSVCARVVDETRQSQAREKTAGGMDNVTGAGVFELPSVA